MTTVERRLSALEAGLSPTERVTAWLADAHQHGSFEAYFESILAAGIGGLPLDRLARETKDAAEAQSRGLPRDERDRAVRSAILATVFRFKLAFRIIELTDRVQERAELVLLALTAGLNLAFELDGQPGKGWPSLEVDRDLLFARAADLAALAEARAQVEAKYLGGHVALFPDARTAWDDLLYRSRAMAMTAWGLTDRYGGAALDEDRFGPTDPERVASYARDMVEAAKAKAYDEMGDGRRSAAIALRWLETKVSAADQSVR